MINPTTARCIKIKTVTKTSKKCPEGKVINPATGRCIKIENLKKRVHNYLRRGPDFRGEKFFFPLAPPKNGRHKKKRKNTTKIILSTGNNFVFP